MVQTRSSNNGLPRPLFEAYVDKADLGDINYLDDVGWVGKLPQKNWQNGRACAIFIEEGELPVLVAKTQFITFAQAEMLIREHIDLDDAYNLQRMEPAPLILGEGTFCVDIFRYMARHWQETGQGTLVLFTQA